MPNMIKAIIFWVLFFLVALALLLVGKTILQLDKKDKYTFLKLAAFAAASATVTTLFLSILVIIF